MGENIAKIIPNLCNNGYSLSEVAGVMNWCTQTTKYKENGSVEIKGRSGTIQ